MIANVSKNNTGKLLVAVLAMIMIVAGATIALSDNVKAADVDYGKEPVAINQAAINELVENGVITVKEPTTWELTGNVTLTDVSIQLSSNLKITSAADDNFSLRVTYNGDAAASNTDVTAAVLGVPSGTANLAIENTTVMFNNTTVNASWTINSSATDTHLNVDVVNSDVTFSKTAENTGGNGALWRTGSGNTTITSDKDSTLPFTTHGSAAKEESKPPGWLTMTGLPGCLVQCTRSSDTASPICSCQGQMSRSLAL